MNYIKYGIITLVCIILVISKSTAEQINPKNLYFIKDSLQQVHTENEQAQKILTGLTWKPTDFHFTIESDDLDLPCNHIIRFPSPKPMGNKINDTVVVEWYQAKNHNSTNKKPAILILHILDGRMIIARAIARGLAEHGVDAFVMHLPTYGNRRTPGFFPSAAAILMRSQQGAADARRAKDVIAALPDISTKRISIQGTSLGGFVSSAAIGIDDAFDKEFILLAGGNLYDMFMNGQREAAMIRRILERDGYTGDKLKALCDSIEPTTLAHRVNPESTFLLSAIHDQVVPLKNANYLAQSLKLNKSHHILMNADHYTGVLYLKWCIQFMADRIHNKPLKDINPIASF